MSIQDAVLIPLSQGYEAIVDAADAEEVLKYRWCVVKAHKRLYAARQVRRSTGRRSMLYLHQIILPGVAEIDHKDRDGLNNRRNNLRACTHSQNMANAEMPLSRYGLRGVHLVSIERKKPFQAQIKVNNRMKSLGYYTTPEEAAEAYDKGAREYFGEFAYQNFPGESCAS